MHEYCTFVANFSTQFQNRVFLFCITLSHVCTNIAHSWLTSQLNFKTALISMAFNLDPNIRAFVSIFSIQFSPWRLIWTRTFVHSCLFSPFNFHLGV